MTAVLVVAREHPVIGALDTMARLGLVERGVLVEVAQLSDSGLPLHRVSRIGEPREGTFGTDGLVPALAGLGIRPGIAPLVLISFREGLSGEVDTPRAAFVLGQAVWDHYPDQWTRPEWVDVIAPGRTQMALARPTDSRVFTVIVEPQERLSPLDVSKDVDPEHLAYHQAWALASVVPLLLDAGAGALEARGPYTDPVVYVARAFARGVVSPSVVAWTAQQLADASSLPTPEGCRAVRDDRAESHLDLLAEQIISANKLGFCPQDDAPKRGPRWRVGPVRALIYLVTRVLDLAHRGIRLWVERLVETRRQKAEDYLTRVLFGKDGRIEVDLLGGDFEEIPQPDRARLPRSDRLELVINALLDNPSVYDIGKSLGGVALSLKKAVDGGVAGGDGGIPPWVLRRAHLIARDPVKWLPWRSITESRQEEWLREAAESLWPIVQRLAGAVDPAEAEPTHESVAVNGAGEEGINAGSGLGIDPGERTSGQEVGGRVPRVIVDMVEAAYRKPAQPAVGVCQWLAGEELSVIAIHAQAHATPLDIVATLAHELAHAALGRGTGHGPRFVKLIDAIGLEGEPESTRVGPEFVGLTGELIERLGAFPSDPPVPLAERLHVACGSAAHRAFTLMTETAHRARQLAEHASSRPAEAQADDESGPVSDSTPAGESPTSEGSADPSAPTPAPSKKQKWLRRLLGWPLTLVTALAGVAIAQACPPLVPLVVVGVLGKVIAYRVWRRREDGDGRPTEHSASYLRQRTRVYAWLGFSVVVAGLLAASFFFPPLFLVAGPIAVIWALGLARAGIGLGREAIDEDHRTTKISEFDATLLQLRHQAAESLRLDRLTESIDRMSRTVGFVAHHPMGLAPRFDGGLLPDADLAALLPLGIDVSLHDMSEHAGGRLVTRATRAVYQRGWFSSLLASLDNEFQTYEDNLDNEVLMASHSPATRGVDPADNVAVRFLVEKGSCLMRGWHVSHLSRALADGLADAVPAPVDDWRDLAPERQGVPLPAMWNPGERIGPPETWIFVDAAREADWASPRTVRLGTGQHAADRCYASLLTRLDLWEEFDVDRLALFVPTDEGSTPYGDGSEAREPEADWDDRAGFEEVPLDASEPEDDAEEET